MSGHAVAMVIEPRLRPVGSGTVRRLLPWRKRRMVGPFTFLDVIGPEDFAPGDGMNVDAHPHIGLATVTYLLEGRVVHRDSTGAVQTITAGDVNWMTAGEGVCHTERSAPQDLADGARVFGIQTWVALPNGDEDDPARFEHRGADELPSLDANGVRVRVAVGSGWGLRSPVAVSSPLVLADVVLESGAIPVAEEHSELAVLCLDGDVRIGDEPIQAGSLAVLRSNSGQVLSGNGRLIVIGGEPVGDRHIWWNFVHSDPERIEDAKQRWTRQEFPLVLDDHARFVPLPV